MIEDLKPSSYSRSSSVIQRHSRASLKCQFLQKAFVLRCDKNQCHCAFHQFLELSFYNFCYWQHSQFTVKYVNLVNWMPYLPSKIWFGVRDGWILEQDGTTPRTAKDTTQFSLKTICNFAVAR